MKKTSLVPFALATACSLPLSVHAQFALISPTPQVITRADSVGNGFPAPASWRIVCPDYLQNSIALKTLRTATPRIDSKAKFRVTIGLQGDKTVRHYGKLIPGRPESYCLRIERDGIVIAADSEQGLYYGVQSLLATMGKGRLEEGSLLDWPDVRYRGVVEGFYGTPWSHEARLRQLEFYGKNKMNIYLYGPKDDPYHSTPHWREPYPAQEAKRMQELINKAHESGVIFYWAIHPGQDIRWDEADRDKLMQKFEAMYALGVRAFAFFFDDISGEGTRADKQAELLNYLDDHFVKVKKDVAPLVMCPTEYNKAWSNDKGGYLRTLGTKLNKGIEIMWTGNSVVHCIDKPSMEWINNRIGRKAYIWWNYPVSDFARDHLQLGPVYGNGLDIANDMSAFVSNPMDKPEASKIALYAVADYTWNMARYDSLASWHRAVAQLLPGHAAELEVIARNACDLGPNGHGFRREESVALKPALDRLRTDLLAAAPSDLDALEKECQQMELSADILLTDKANPMLIDEIKPWLIQAKLIGEYGQTVVGLARQADSDADADAFESFRTLYDRAVSLQTQMYDVDITYNQNPYQPGVKLAERELLPTVSALFKAAVDSYNQHHGTTLAARTTYTPERLQTSIKQLANQPIRSRNNTVSLSPSNEVITWQPADHLTITMERTTALAGLDFNFGKAGIAALFKLEISENGTNWRPIGLTQVEGDKTVHTTEAINGAKAKSIRLTYTGKQPIELYLRSFKFNKHR